MNLLGVKVSVRVMSTLASYRFGAMHAVRRDRALVVVKCSADDLRKVQELDRDLVELELREHTGVKGDFNWRIEPLQERRLSEEGEG